MRRLFLVYNPRSSRYAEVEKAVLAPARDLKGYVICKYEIKPTSIDDNIAKLKSLLKDEDLVVSAGGDATGVVAANAAIKSNKDITLAVLPYGNFNDLARTLRTTKLQEVLHDCQEQKLYPLEIWIDGKFYRYATCYVTIGMTAESVYIYDLPKFRKKLKSHFGRSISSYTELMVWYFKHRHKKQFIPEFSLNGVPMDKRISDYAAVNGRSMARVMKGGEDFLKPKEFHRETDRLTNLWRLFKLMIRSIFVRIPGEITTNDVLEFAKPSTVTLQAEGEKIVCHDAKKIEIKKGDKWLKVKAI